MNFFRFVLLVFSFFCLHAESYGASGGFVWPELNPETWAIKASDYPDGNGAVVLVDRYHFHRRSLERFRRVLVLAEAGRQLAEIQVGGAQIENLEGRTLYSDGKALPFVQGGDIVKLVIVSSKREKVEALRVIPPGVTQHCVVDVHWSEPINAESRPIPDGYDFHLLFSMSGTAPVRMAEILFDPDLSDYGWQRKFEVQPGQKYKEFQENGRTSYLFENIQARQTVPFASEADLRSPVCSWYWAPQMREWLMSVGFPEDKPINLINAAACTVFYSYLMDPVENKRGLRSTLRGMGQGLDNLSIRERAISLMRNLRSKVKTLSELPEIQHQKELKSGPEAVLKRGWGTSEQLNLLGFHVLRENGLSASWVMAIDREENRLLDPNNLWQYDNMLLLVLDERGEPIYLNPGSTYTPVGLPPWLQSSKALVIFSTKERLEWTGKFFALPSVNPEKNSQIWKSVILPGVDSDDFDVSFEATGNAASHWKSVLGGQHAGDLAKGLKPLVEREGFLVRSASGDDLLDPWKKMAFKFQGTFEHEGGRKRVLSPFLFLRTPFVIPPSWPENRTFAIHLPMTTLIQAEARIPWKGEAPTAKELDPTQHENYFGKVSWSGEMTEGNKGKELLIRLKIEVSSILGAPSKYGEMKEFTGWIREALGRGVFAPQI